MTRGGRLRGAGFANPGWAKARARAGRRDGREGVGSEDDGKGFEWQTKVLFYWCDARIAPM